MKSTAFHRQMSAPVLGALLLCVAAAALAEETIPKPFPTGRYEPLRGHSPFALATVEAPPAPPQASFAANWFVSGIGRIGDTDFVTIKSRDLSKQFSLYGKEPFEGVSVASVTWSENVGKSTVILQKGTETAKLEFNEADVHAPPQPLAQQKPQPGVPQPGLPQAGQPRPASTVPRPGVPTGLPPGVPQVPIPNGTIAPPQPAMAGTGTAPAVRRRAQVIVPPQ